MAINWEPSEFDRVFKVSGALSVTTSSGHRMLGYPQPVSVSADNPRDAKSKVRALLLARCGLSEAHVIEDMLKVAS